MSSPIQPRGSEGRVRVVKVTRNGGDAGWSALGSSVKNLSPYGFVAIDTEFSGLGTDPLLTDDDISVRYEAMRSVVERGAVLSLGVAVFNPSNASAESRVEEAQQPASYEVAAFDFTMCCESPWTVSADSARFLVSHSFDFNRLFTSGIPYHRASSEEADVKGARTEQLSSESVTRPAERSVRCFNWGPMPRGLLWRLGRAYVPIIVHNGLMDLMFLFSAFHGPLPTTLNLFIATLLDSVPAGIFDTKHLVSTVRPERASFLAFLYARAVQHRSVVVSSSKGLPHPDVASPEDFLSSVRAAAAAVENGKDQVSRVDKSTLGATENNAVEICALYGLRGFCPKGARCLLSHDVFEVLKYERNNALPDIKNARKAYNKMQKAAKEARCSKAEAKGGLVEGGTEGPPKRAAEASDEMDSHGGKKRRMSKKARRRSIEALAAAGAHAAPVAAEDARSVCLSAPSHSASGDHSAGWDAYMTGFCFAAVRAHVGRTALDAERNRLALAKKAAPLLLCRSAFDGGPARVPSEASPPAAPATVPAAATTGQAARDELDGEEAQEIEGR